MEWADGKDAEFPTGPLYWVPIDGGKRLQCVARGTVGGKERREVVGSIPVAVAKEEDQQHQQEAAVNGAADEAIKTGQQPVVGEPVVNGVADVPITNGDEVTATPAETNGLAPPAVEDELASPASEKFVDAPSEPLVSPPLDIKDLSLEDPTDEKKMVETAEAIPNAKAVAAA